MTRLEKLARRHSLHLTMVWVALALGNGTLVTLALAGPGSGSEADRAGVLVFTAVGVAWNLIAVVRALRLVPARARPPSFVEDSRSETRAGSRRKEQR